MGMVGRHVADRRDRLECYAVAMQWWVVNWNLLRAMSDLICAIDPAMFARLERLKHLLIGPSADNVVNRCDARRGPS